MALMTATQRPVSWNSPCLLHHQFAVLTSVMVIMDVIHIQQKIKQ